MKPPIIDISEPNDVLIFETQAKAELYLEAIDYEDEDYLMLDSEGRRLSVRPHPNGSIIIDPNYAEPTHAKELQEALITFFIAVGEDEEWCSRATLEELVIKGLEYKTE